MFRFLRRRSAQPTAPPPPTYASVARALAGNVNSPKIVAAFRQVVEQMGHSPSVTHRQENELAVINLFAAAAGTLAAKAPDSVKTKLHAELLRAAQHEVFSAEAERSDFITLYSQRESEYQAAHAASEAQPTRLGLLLAQNLIGSPDPAVATFARLLLHRRMLAAQQFVSQVAALLSPT